MIKYFVGAPVSFNCPCLVTVLLGVRPMIALFNYEITVSLKNKRKLGLRL